MTSAGRATNVELHARIWRSDDGACSMPLFGRGDRIAATRSASAHRIDLRDHIVFPGLINAHDHLHVNSVPRLEAKEPFANSYAWIEAFQQHFLEPAVIAELRVAKAVRLRHGALKNLLAGTTCVAHHDPWHPALDVPDFPVALLRNFGWSYALGWPQYGPPARESFAATSPDRPWLIHLAEGTDAVAQAELQRLDDMGCLAANTVLIHGVGLRKQDVDSVIARGAAVVWCPSSNLALLGHTLDPRRLQAAGRLALGTDSRLSGARDLLEEMRWIAGSCGLDAQQILALCTTQAADILRMPQRGHLAPGTAADFFIVRDRGGDAVSSLVGIERSAIRAVVRDGLPCIADPDLADWFAVAGVDTVAVTLDGERKLMASALADPQVIALEPGLDIAVTAGRYALPEEACSA